MPFSKRLPVVLAKAARTAWELAVQTGMCLDLQICSNVKRRYLRKSSDTYFKNSLFTLRCSAKIEVLLQFAALEMKTRIVSSKFLRFLPCILCTINEVLVL